MCAERRAGRGNRNRNRILEDGDCIEDIGKSQVDMWTTVQQSGREKRTGKYKGTRQGRERKQQGDME